MFSIEGFILIYLRDIKTYYRKIISMQLTRDRGSTRSALARRRGGDRFESRLDTTS